MSLPIADAVASTADEGAFLLGFVVVAEWQGVDGNRTLSQQSGTGNGEWVPQWQVRGYLNEALNHWPEPQEDDEED
jgi:hypothetical protein